MASGARWLDGSPSADSSGSIESALRDILMDALDESTLPYTASILDEVMRDTQAAAAWSCDCAGPGQPGPRRAGQQAPVPLCPQQS